MRIADLKQLFSVRDLRNAVVGTIVVSGGILLAALTMLAHQTGNTRLAGIAAGVSLVFVLLILIFVVPPLARNASKEASQMNLPFDFTIGGAIMFGLIMIVGFSAWNTGNNLLFLVLSFLTAAMVVGFFAGGICLNKVDVKMRFPETIFAGEETPILVSLHNRKRLFPCFSVVAEVRGKVRERSIAAAEIQKILPRSIAERFSRPPVVRRTLDYFAYIPRSETIETRKLHMFPNRGRFVIKDFEISTKFPFAFFRHRRRLPAKETELIVFPKIEPVDHVLDDIPLDVGKLVANKRGSGQDLLALREYQPNDDLRRIDWKATARTSQLTVREFSAEDDKKITIFLDARVPEMLERRMSLREKLEAEQKGDGGPVSPRFERGLSLVASMLAHFTDEQAEIRLVIGTEAGDFGVGTRHLHESLKRLAFVEPELVPKMDFGALSAYMMDLLDESDDTHVFLFTTARERSISPELIQRSKLIPY
jgi:uncharacterized protein (DUF58 family)